MASPQRHKRSARWFIGGGLLLSVLLAGLLWAPRARVPSHDGRTVQDWFERYVERQRNGPSFHITQEIFNAHVEDIDAFLQLGAEALPYLSRQLDEDSAINRIYRDLHGTLPRSFRKVLPDPIPIPNRQAWALEVIGIIGLSLRHDPLEDRTASFEKIMPKVRTMSESAIKDTRTKALLAMGQIGLDPEQSKAALAAALRENDPRVRKSSVEGMGAIGMEEAGDPEIISTLHGACNDADPGVRAQALVMLAGVAPGDDDILQTFEINATNGSPIVRYSVAWAAKKLDPTLSMRTVPILEKLVRDEDQLVRSWAAGALNEIAPDVAAALAVRLILDAEPALDNMTFIPGKLARDRSIQVYGIQGRVLHLQNADPNVRAVSAYMLGELGREPEKCVPALAGVLRDPYPLVRQWAARSLELFNKGKSNQR